MTSRLAHVPTGARRRLTATLGLFAALFVVIAAVSATAGGPASGVVFAVLAALVALFLATMAWGVHRSVGIDLGRIAAPRAATPPGPCGCGHDHDAADLHVTDAEPCAHDGAGDACSHDCGTCVLQRIK